MEHRFDHENLDVYRLALGSAAEVCAVLDLSRTGEAYALPTEAPPSRSHARSDVEAVGPCPKVSPGRTVHAMKRLLVSTNAG